MIEVGKVHLEIEVIYVKKCM